MPTGATVVENWLWTMVNVGCQLAGYYAAALTIEWKFFGRVRMQVGHSLHPVQQERFSEKFHPNTKSLEHNCM